MPYSQDKNTLLLNSYFVRKHITFLFIFHFFFTLINFLIIKSFFNLFYCQI